MNDENEWTDYESIELILSEISVPVRKCFLTETPGEEGLPFLLQPME